MNTPARLLAGLAALLALVLALEWLLPNQYAPAATVPLARLHATGRTAALPARRTTVWAQAVLARPVFSISRRPPKIAASGPTAAGPGQARLAGIMITRYGRRAIFAPEAGGHALVLSEGGAVNQTTIRSILPDRVVLVSGAVLHPAYDRNKPPAPAPFQPPIAPFTPGFPTFPNAAGQFSNPNFPVSGIPQPGFAAPGFQPGGAQANGEDGVQPVPPPQPFRGGLIPQRRQ